MRLSALFALGLSLLAHPALAERKDSSPLIKAPSTVVPCLQSCEAEFADCESRPAATTKICPEARRACIVRCDPAVLSNDTLKALRRTPEELRYRPAVPQTPGEQCRQGCQDRRAVCQDQNDTVACDPSTSACYDRCDASYPAAASKPLRPDARPKAP